jgi:hypothetical protein
MALLDNSQREELRILLGLAHNILEPKEIETPYSKNKHLISEIFKETIHWNNKEEMRLFLIDSLYSTNMSMRMYGISDIADEMKKIEYSNNSIKEKALHFIDNMESNDNNEIVSMFIKRYGMHKGDSESQGSAISLISKYLYFLTEYNFPIYDSLVRDSLAEIFYLKKTGNFYSCFSDLYKIKNEYSIESYDVLDNLLWLWGKICKGSYSLILNRENYTMLINELKLKSKKSKEIDNEMKIKEYEIVKIINNNDFTNFVELKNKWKRQ